MMMLALWWVWVSFQTPAASSPDQGKPIPANAATTQAEIQWDRTSRLPILFRDFNGEETTLERAKTGREVTIQRPGEDARSRTALIYKRLY